MTRDFTGSSWILCCTFDFVGKILFSKKSPTIDRIGANFEACFEACVEACFFVCEFCSFFVETMARKLEKTSVLK